MHEVGILQGLMEEIISQAKKQNAVKVTRVKVKTGKLEELTLDSFCFWFEQLSKGTIVDGAELVLTNTTDEEAGVYLEEMEVERDE